MRPGAGLSCDRDRAECCTDPFNLHSLVKPTPYKRRSGPAESALVKRPKLGQNPVLSGFLAEVIGAIPEEYTEAREELVAHLLSLGPCHTQSFPIE